MLNTQNAVGITEHCHKNLQASRLEIKATKALNVLD